MSKVVCNSEKGYYINQAKKKEDKYLGLFSKKQLEDLEYGSSLPVEKINSKELKRKLKEQKGVGDTFLSFAATSTRPRCGSDDL